MPKHIKDGALRVWWIPQIPGDPFYWPVSSVKEAITVLNLLAQYDIFRYKQRIKPYLSIAGGLEIFERGTWIEWRSNDGTDVFGNNEWE